MQWILLALRNLTRNRRRTAVTLAGLTIGIGAALVLQGFATGIVTLIGGLMVEGRLGAVQVHKTGHLQADQNALDFTLPDSAELRARLAAMPGVTAVAARLSFEATLGNGQQSTLALVSAIEPVADRKVCPVRFANVIGKGIESTDKNGAVLGIRLAEGLRALPGETLQLMATGPDNRPNLLDLRVAGKLPATTELDARRLVVVQLGYAQELLQMPGRVTEYSLAINEFSQADKIAGQVQAALGPDYQVVSWLDLLPQIRSVLGMLTVVMRVVVAVLLLLLATAVANTMYMTVHERVREIGTMLALGVRRQEVVRLLVSEAILLGILGSCLGVAAGTLLVYCLQTHGVTLRAPGADVESQLRPSISALAVVGTALLALVATALAAAGPAWRAAKLSPVECLRAT